ARSPTAPHAPATTGSPPPARPNHRRDAGAPAAHAATAAGFTAHTPKAGPPPTTPTPTTPTPTATSTCAPGTTCTPNTPACARPTANPPSSSAPSSASRSTGYPPATAGGPRSCGCGGPARPTPHPTCPRSSAPPCTAFDIEHPIRFAKQTLGWTTPKIRPPEQAQRWSWLVLAAYTQLRLARRVAGDPRLPWQPPLPTDELTPGRVRTGFGHLLPTLHTPTSPPKTLTPGPGRPKGRRSTPAPRCPAVKVPAANPPKRSKKVKT